MEYPPITKGPFSAPRDPKSYPSARKALIPGRQQDWIYARTQYEANIKSVSLIAQEIGVGPTAVYSRASNEGWTKNVEARAQYVAGRQLALEAARDATLELETKKADRVNAEMQARVLVIHRTDVAKARIITMKLFHELETMMENTPELKSLGEILRDEDDRGRDKLNDIYQAIISLPDRVDVNKKLAESLKTLLQLERQAFGIVGALEDPTQPQVAGVGSSEIDKILNKFDLVLTKKSPESTAQAQVLGEVIDVSPAN